MNNRGLAPLAIILIAVGVLIAGIGGYIVAKQQVAPSQFIELDKSCDIYSDGIHVYIADAGPAMGGVRFPEFILIEGSDAKTFHFLDGRCGYSADKNAVYYPDADRGVRGWDWRPFGGMVSVLQGADPATFSAIDPTTPYGRDKARVFFDGMPIIGADPDSFTLLGYTGTHFFSGYAKDRNSVYYNGKKIDGADSASFTLLESTGSRWYASRYAEDRNSIYYNDKRVDGADPSLETVVTESILRNGNVLYDEGIREE